MSPDGKIWRDISANGNDVTILQQLSTTRYKSLNNTLAVTGTPTSRIMFPTGLLTSEYTLIHVCKHDGDMRGKIISSSDTPTWASGFWNSHSGVCFQNGWITSLHDHHGKSWVVSVEQPGFYRSNGTTRVKYPVPSVTIPETIVVNGIGDDSHFAIAMIVIYSRILTRQEILVWESFLKSRLDISKVIQQETETQDASYAYLTFDNLFRVMDTTSMVTSVSGNYSIKINPEGIDLLMFDQTVASLFIRSDANEEDPSCDSASAASAMNDCEVTWDEWSKCDRDCGGGRQVQNFTVKRVANGGRACPQPIIRDCNTHPCNITCDGQWSDWSVCDKQCGGGLQTRNFISNKIVSGCPITETRPCNPNPCKLFTCVNDGFVGIRAARALNTITFGVCDAFAWEWKLVVGVVYIRHSSNEKIVDGNTSAFIVEKNRHVLVGVTENGQMYETLTQTNLAFPKYTLMNAMSTLMATRYKFRFSDNGNVTLSDTNISMRNAVLWSSKTYNSPARKMILFDSSYDLTLLLTDENETMIVWSLPIPRVAQGPPNKLRVTNEGHVCIISKAGTILGYVFQNTLQNVISSRSFRSKEPPVVGPVLYVTADSYRSKSRQWLNMSGDPRIQNPEIVDTGIPTIETQTSKGVNIKYLHGEQNCVIQLLSGEMFFSSYTLIYIARFSSSTDAKKCNSIFTNFDDTDPLDVADDAYSESRSEQELKRFWSSGFHSFTNTDGRKTVATGVAFRGVWFTERSTNHMMGSWILGVDRFSDGGGASSYRSNFNERRANLTGRNSNLFGKGVSFGKELFINGITTMRSSWDVACVLLYDRYLKDAEVSSIEKWMDSSDMYTGFRNIVN